jgi:hypothetical protein
MTYGEEIKAGRFVVELWNAHARQGSMDWLNICSRMIFEHDKAICAEARAEALREAADRLRMTFFRDTGPYGYDGAKSNVDALNECETLCAAITQEPKP